MDTSHIYNIEIDRDLLVEYYNTRNYDKLAQYVKSAFEFKQDPSGKAMISSFSRDAVQALMELVYTLDIKCDDVSDCLAPELFRALRNYTAIHREVAECLIKEKGFMAHVHLLLTGDDKPHQYKRYLLQFLINLVILVKERFYIVTDLHTTLMSLMTLLAQQIYTNEVSALLYNISLHSSIADLGMDFYKIVLNLYETNYSLEFLHFLLEKCLTYENFWNEYGSHKINHRLIVLEVVKDQHMKGHDSSLPPAAFDALIGHFVRSCDTIFQTVRSTSSDVEPHEVASLAETLSSLSGCEKYQNILQQNKDFFIHCGAILLNVHQLGKQSENYFTSIQKLGEITEPNERIKQHPAFGFKVSLVRIIGNLCWKNRTMQNLARQCELIPVLLDCCNIDARNPFIIQWVIFAIRNVCENNLENQAVIAGLNRQGVVSSSILQEMGLTLNSDGENAISLISLDSLKIE